MAVRRPGPPKSRKTVAEVKAMEEKLDLIRFVVLEVWEAKEQFYRDFPHADRVKVGYKLAQALHDIKAVLME